MVTQHTDAVQAVFYNGINLLTNANYGMHDDTCTCGRTCSVLTKFKWFVVFVCNYNRWRYLLLTWGRCKTYKNMEFL